MKIKNLLLIPALMGTMAMASEYNYELSPVVGYNFFEGNQHLDSEIMSGLEAQYNGFDFPIKPELSILYSGGIESDDLITDEKTNMYRFALNGVYELEGMDSIIPFAKAGVGYETMNRHIANNTDGVYFDAGAGVKVPLTEMIALKVEALYMLKVNGNTAGGSLGDSNLALLAGLTFSFGEKAQKAAPVVVDGDDDNDGVKNSMDKCLTTPPGATINTSGCTIDADDDKDTVFNSFDKCPNSPAGAVVDPDGCCIVVDGDDDKDGVLNSIDLCPNTTFGISVNSDGCLEKITLNINFAHDSSEIESSSFGIVQEYADFLNKHTIYNSKIIGHTDNTGDANYNLNLSDKRANAVKEMLIEKGISADRLTSSGEGETNPIANNDTKEGRSHNRRIEATLIKE